MLIQIFFIQKQKYCKHLGLLHAEKITNYGFRRITYKFASTRDKEKRYEWNASTEKITSSGLYERLIKFLHSALSRQLTYNWMFNVISVNFYVPLSFTVHCTIVRKIFAIIAEAVIQQRAIGMFYMTKWWISPISNVSVFLDREDLSFSPFSFSLLRLWIIHFGASAFVSTLEHNLTQRRIFWEEKKEGKKNFSELEKCFK